MLLLSKGGALHAKDSHGATPLSLVAGNPIATPNPVALTLTLQPSPKPYSPRPHPSPSPSLSPSPSPGPEHHLRPVYLVAASGDRALNEQLQQWVKAERARRASSRDAAQEDGGGAAAAGQPSLRRDEL